MKSVDQILRSAKSKSQNGDFHSAKKMYHTILLKHPRNAKAIKGLQRVNDVISNQRLDPPKSTLQFIISLYEADDYTLVVEHVQRLTTKFKYSLILWSLLGAACLKLGKNKDASHAFRQITLLDPNKAEGHMNLGVALANDGCFNDAIEHYEQAINLNPNLADAHYNLGNALKHTGHLNEAVDAYQCAIQIKPNMVEAYTNLGAILGKQNNLEGAIQAYYEAIKINSTHAAAHYNLANALAGQGHLDSAVAAYEKATMLHPNYADAFNNLGSVYKKQNKFDQAITAFKKAAFIKPDFAEAICNLGTVLVEKRLLNEAIDCYQKAISINSDYAEAYNNLGNAYMEQRKLSEATAAFKRAIILKPSYAHAFNNLGNVLADQDEYSKAIKAYQKATSLKIDYFDPYYNLGNCLKSNGRFGEAIDYYETALSLDPFKEVTRAEKLHLLSHVCDWPSVKDDSDLIPTLGTVDKFVSPFAMLSLEDAPERHRQRSELFAKAKFAHASKDYSPNSRVKSSRLRVGYFSADFHNHATMFLLASVFEAHDKDKFEISVYSYGPDQQDDMRQRLKDAVDHFYDVKDMSDEQITNLARENNLDIAVDLKGFTQHNRLGPFSHRIAPVQISYLGYPGTLGTDFIDYIVADKTVIPNDKRKFYSEQIIYLPNSYQPTDNKRIISKKMFTKGDLGLPDNGFVFCCFNNTYKITPVEFDIWMRLLHQVDGSVLWLLKSNKWAEQNLRKEAKIRGIDEKRLIFADRAPQAEHLARQRLADLFLDTFNVNAHTTTSDALWAGLPVITKPGEGFAARVAASLLNAIGLPELVTKTTAQYEALALELAQNPSRLKHLKNTLSQNRLTHPLFNSVMYTEHLERGYKMAFDNHSNGHKPATIIVPE